VTASMPPMSRPNPLAGRLLRYATYLGPLARIPAALSGRLASLVPALLAGTGVFLVAVGLFNYAGSTAALPNPATTGPSPSEGMPTFSLAPPSIASPGAGAIAGGVPTRIVIPSLAVDLPIIESPANEVFPLCDVAEYLTLGRLQVAPGLPQAIYLYAHARTGMFLPLLNGSQKNNGAAMIGDVVLIYTDDDRNHVYEISEVIRHVPVSSAALDRALTATTEELWLQTSEGPKTSSPKLQVIALPVGVLAASHADAHPSGRGRVCPDAPRCTAAGQSGCRR
jgi:hypothetical protein